MPATTLLDLGAVASRMAAWARGRKGGRPRCDPHKLRQALKLYEAGQHTVAEIEELTGIKKATLYRARKTHLEP